MGSNRRWQLGSAGIAVGLALGIGTRILGAQGAPAAAPLPGWTEWLQVSVNLTKIVEMAVFIFSGYQFWKGRRERRAADAEAAEQARIDSIYQAWQVLNSAQGKGGSGGRVEALRALVLNGVSLAGINLDGAWLEHAQLQRANMTRSSLQHANFTHADFSGANLEAADLGHATLVTANLSGANLRGANLAGARLSACTLDGADLKDVQGWDAVISISYASIEGVRNAPAGFVEFALAQGAVDTGVGTEQAEDELSFSQHFRIV